MAKHEKVKWGVLSTADIGLTKVLPAMQKGELCDIAAISSRNLAAAEDAAGKLGIPKAYGSYEELLGDPNIEAVYNPLPNHLHLEWTRKCIEAGKHVLCEKPLVVSPDDIAELKELSRSTGLLIGEAFMVLHHPRWRRVRELIQSGEAGDLRALSCFFSYFNRDSKDIRNNKDYYGGGIYDIGCYAIVVSRYMFGSEPLKVAALLEHDQQFKVDRLGSVLMDFPTGQAMFTVSTQLTPYQVVQVFGTKKKYEIPIPFNVPNDRPVQILSHVNDILGPDVVEETFDACDQYTLQGDAFSRSVRENIPFAGSLDNALGNAKVIDAVFRAAKSGAWEQV